MINSISEFERLVFIEIVELSYEEKCIYCDWSVNRLYASYSSLLIIRFGPLVAALAETCKDHLSKAVQDKTFIIDDHFRNQHSMQRLEIEFELDFRKSEDCAILKLTEAIDSTFKFMVTKKSDFVMLMPLLPVEIIHTVLSNEYGLDAEDIDRIIWHELFQKEFEKQLERLKNVRS